MTPLDLCRFMAGWALVLLPVVGMTAAMSYQYGIATAAGIWGLIIAVVACTFGGLWILHPDGRP